MRVVVIAGPNGAGKSTFAYAARLRRWQAGGYRVLIVYLRLDSADQAVERIARRVREGGHDIPEAVVRRRFERSWSNFVELYRDVADEWQLYDNSGPESILVAQSPGWRAVRESRASGYADSETTASRRRIMATETPPRFPEGEPSPKSVLAALVRARKRAMARAAAVRRGERVAAALGSGDRRPKADASVIAGGELDG